MAFARRSIPVDKLPPSVTAKWSVGVLSEGFVPFPKKLLRILPDVFAGDLAFDELRLTLAIIDYRRPNLRMEPSLPYLAYWAGLSVGEARAALKSLRDKGLIKADDCEDQLTIEVTGLLARIEELAAMRDAEDTP